MHDKLKKVTCTRKIMMRIRCPRITHMHKDVTVSPRLPQKEKDDNVTWNISFFGINCFLKKLLSLLFVFFLHRTEIPN